MQGIDDKGNQFSHTQKTDTHWRAQNGRGSFNYRIIYKFPLNKLRQPRLKFQVGGAFAISRHGVLNRKFAFSKEAWYWTRSYG